MEIRSYELYQVPPRWLFLRVETSDGIVGWGEPIVEGKAKTTQAAVEELMDQCIVGEDPLEIERLWQAMYRGGFYRGGPVLMSAISGIDQALWDIKGKRYDAPVYDLLGGKARDRIRMYQHATPDEAIDAVDAGYTAVKTSVDPPLERVEDPGTLERRAIAPVRKVREAVGDEVDVGVDFHGRVSKPIAKRIASMLEPYEPMFLEEPVLPEHDDALAAIAGHTSTPIATGERLFSRADFKPLFEAGAVDVIQPDLSHAGGITEVRKIAAMAEAYDVALAPHCPLGPIALASCLQIDACTPNALIQEQALDVHYTDGNEIPAYVREQDFGFEDGYVPVPDGPGLGVEPNLETIRANAVEDLGWRNPTLEHADGSVAEW